MKTFHAIALLFLLTAVSSHGTHVRFTFKDFIGGNITNKPFAMRPITTPTVSGGAIIMNEPLYTNTFTGIIIVSNVTPAVIYRCEVRTFLSSNVWNILVPDTNGIVEARAIITTATNVSSSAVAYSQASSDDRYVLRSVGWSTNQTLTNAVLRNGTNFFTVPTNRVVQGSSFAAIDTNGNVFAATVSGGSTYNFDATQFGIDSVTNVAIAKGAVLTNIILQQDGIQEALMFTTGSGIRMTNGSAAFNSNSIVRIGDTTGLGAANMRFGKGSYVSDYTGSEQWNFKTATSGGGDSNTVVRFWNLNSSQLSYVSDATGAGGNLSIASGTQVTNPAIFASSVLSVASRISAPANPNTNLLELRTNSVLVTFVNSNGTIQAPGLTIPTGASSGYLWTSGSGGAGSWAAPPTNGFVGSSVTNGLATTNYVNNYGRESFLFNIGDMDSAPPSSGQLNSDFSSFAGLTTLFVSDTNKVGTYIDGWLDNITNSDQIALFDRLTGTNYAVYIIGSAQDNGGYHTFQVSVVFTNGSVSAGTDVILARQPAHVNTFATSAALAAYQIGSMTLSNIASGTYNLTNTTSYGSAATSTPLTINTPANPTANLATFQTNSVTVATIRSNGTFVANVGTAAAASYGFLDATNSGMSHAQGGSTISFYISGTEEYEMTANTLNGFSIATSRPLSWGTAVGSSDVRIYRDAAGILALRMGTTPATNKVYGTFTSTSSGECLESGYNGTHAWFFLESNTNGAGTLRPLALGVTTNASIVIDVTGGTTQRTAHTNNAVMNIKTGGLIIGANGTAITNILTGSANLDFPDTAAGTTSDLSISVTGTGTNDVVTLGAPAVAANIGGTFTAFPSNDTVYIRFANNNLVTSLNPGPAVFKVMVTKW